MRRKALEDLGYCAVLISDSEECARLKQNKIQVGTVRLFRYGKVFLYKSFKDNSLARLPKKFAKRLLSVGPDYQDMVAGCDTYFWASPRFFVNNKLANKFVFSSF